MNGPRTPDGGLPESNFLSPAPGGSLFDTGVNVGIPFEGSAPDIGAFEYKPLIDTTAPTISSVAVPSDNELVVVFSESVTTATAESPANYSLDNDATISTASLAGDGRTVMLTASSLSAGIPYTLITIGVEDTSPNANPSNDSFVFVRSLFSSWKENFEDDLSDGASVDNGDTAWITSGFADSGGGEYFAVSGGRFESHVTGDEAVWTSETIDISQASSVDLSVDLISSPGPGGLESSDYVRTYYKLDGGEEVEFSEYLGQIPGDFQQVTVSDLSGGTVEIIIKTKTGGYNERYLWDNVSVTESAVSGGETFANWYAARTGNVPLYNDDSDGDLIPALFEYAFDLNPLNSEIPAANPLPALVLDNSRAGLVFSRFEDRTDLIYEVQSSNDHVTWTTIARSIAGGPMTDVGGSTFNIQEAGTGEVSISVTESNVPGSAGFLRMRITHIP